MDAVLNPKFFGRIKLLDNRSEKDKDPMREIMTAYCGGFLILPQIKVKGRWYPAKKINNDLLELTELGFNMYKKANKLKPEGDGM